MDNFKAFESKKVVVVLGAGGVGKTTSSTLFAVRAACEGKRVGLLSIDPAKRLADAMGLTLGSQLTKVELNCPGSLHAAMLDQKEVFDELVDRFTKSPAKRKKIANNLLYRAASTKFGGALEYLALAKLQKMVDSGEFDLIVLDTPPDAHALDFLAKPNALAGFMEQRVMTWIIKPVALAHKLGVTKIGERLIGGIAEVTGIKALQVLAEFMVLMQDFIEGLHGLSQKIVKILQSESTAFVIVSTLRSSPIRSVQSLWRQLEQQGHSLHMMVLNRTIPESIAMDLESLEIETKTFACLLSEHKLAQDLRSKIDSFSCEMQRKPHFSLQIDEQFSSIDSIERIKLVAEGLRL